MQMNGWGDGKDVRVYRKEQCVGSGEDGGSSLTISLTAFLI